MPHHCVLLLTVYIKGEESQSTVEMHIEIPTKPHDTGPIRYEFDVYQSDSLPPQDSSDPGPSHYCRASDDQNSTLGVKYSSEWREDFSFHNTYEVELQGLSRKRHCEGRSPLIAVLCSVRRTFCLPLTEDEARIPFFSVKVTSLHYENHVCLQQHGEWLTANITDGEDRRPIAPNGSKFHINNPASVVNYPGDEAETLLNTAAANEI